MISERLRFKIQQHRYRCCCRYRFAKLFGSARSWQPETKWTYGDDLRERALIVDLYYQDDAYIKARSHWLLGVLREKYWFHDQRTRKYGRGQI